MTTTAAAALQAHVTVATIRTWCRRGVITAAKRAGRWVIDAASLAHRITIGAMRARRGPMTTYRIEQGTVTRYGHERTAWTIVRTDGTPAGYGRDADPRIHDAEFSTLATAEFYMEFLENTPRGYSLDQVRPRANSMDRKTYWIVKGSAGDDPGTLKQYVDADRDESDRRTVDILIQLAVQHAAGAEERIQAKAATDAAEAVKEARKRRLAELRATRGELATPRQVDYILQLLAYRERTGEGGGFMYGPTDRAGVEEMSKADASMYITSLKGDY